MADPTPLKRPINWDRLNAADAESVVRERAKVTENILFGTHAWDRVDERSITQVEAYEILRRGYVDGEPTREADGSWKVIMTRKMNRSRSAGVVTLILSGEDLFVKTVMWMDL
jgi:hypothetical protein